MFAASSVRRLVGLWLLALVAQQCSLLMLSAEGAQLQATPSSSASESTPLQLELSRLNSERKARLAVDAAKPRGQCPEIALSEPVVMNKNLSSYDIGANVVVSCQSGYKLVRSSRLSAIPADSSKAKDAKEFLTLTCLEGSEGAKPSWSSAPATVSCIPAACAPIVLKDKNLEVDKATGVHGDVRRFSCAEPYTLDGPKQTICDAGIWTPSSKPTCFLSECDAYTAPSNGFASVTSNSSSAVKTLRYGCNVGFKMEGHPEAYCTPSKNWSSKAPRCVEFGLKPYLKRVATFSAGSISIDNSYVLRGLMDSARHTPNCIGVTISRVDGAVRAVFLHSDESFLERKSRHDTYLFTQGGKYEVHRGFAASSTRAVLGPVEFAKDAHVLSGIQSAVNKLKGTQTDLLGFSIANGQNFLVQLATWTSFPLVADEEFTTYTLTSVERKIREVGCFAGDENNEGRGPLMARQLIANLEEGQKASRLSCASFARAHGHKFFSLSNGKCFTGNEDPARYGDAKAKYACGGRFAEPHKSQKPGAIAGAYHSFSVDSVYLFSGIHASRCKYQFNRRLSVKPSADKVLGNATKVDLTESCMNLCSNTLACTQALYNKQSKLCTMYTGGRYNGTLATKNKQFTSFDCHSPVLINGGFEDEFLGGSFSMLPGRRSLHFTSAAGAEKPRGWTVAGNVGVAVLGSNYTNLEKSIPDGAHIVYLKSGAQLSQKLTGLKLGRNYQISFYESFRVPNELSPLYTSGMTLSVYVGPRMVYSNLNVNVPLWEKKIATFTATAADMEVRILASDEHLRARLIEQGADAASLQIRSAVLLDTIRVEKERLRSHRGRDSLTGRGIIANVSVKHPRVLSALAALVQPLPNAAGFYVKDSEVKLVSKNQLASKQIVADANSTLYLLNGTVLAGFRTHLSSGGLSFNHQAEIHRALQEIASTKSNSLGYTVSAGPAFEARILGAAALPLEDEAQSDVFFYPEHVRNMGCWNALYQANNAAPPLIFENKQDIVGGVGKHACALAAARAGHRYFALQNKVCSSGNGDDFRLHGASSECSLRCHNGKDLCGGERAAIVYRLPSFVRLSRGGVITMKPKLPPTANDFTRLTFEEPGSSDFTTVGAQLTEAETKELAVRPLRNDGSKILFRHSLVYHFPGSQRAVVSLYTIHAPVKKESLGLAPKSWILSASNCGRKWTVLDEAEGVKFTAAGQTRSFELKNSKEYHFYRLIVNENQSGASKDLGFAVSGVQLQGAADTLISLASLYRFEDQEALGMDASTQFNDLMVFGQSKNVRIGQAHDLAFMGNGYLELHPDPAGDATYLALDDKLTAIRGLPSKFDSFSVSFWFRVFSSSLVGDFAPMGVLSWGEINGMSGQAVQLSSAIEKISSSFGVPGQGLRGAGKNASSLVEAWHHYTITFDYDSGLHVIYLDGEEIASRLVDQTRYRLSASNFKIGLTTLYGPLKDQFVGLLDDIAVFKGALNPEQVREAQYGDFTAFLPLTCQQISDRFGVATAETWGSADDRVKKEYLRARCNTSPSTCQTYSDVFNISPDSKGKADLYVQDAFAAMSCITWPSFQVRANSVAGCQGKQVVKYNVIDLEDARRRCLDQHEPACKAYVWSATPRDHEMPDGKVVRVPANTLSMCNQKLAGYTTVEGSEVAHRLRSYLVLTDTSNRCDEEQGTVVAGITNNMDARALCDKAYKPACKGYIWTGPIGLGRNSSNTPTPNMVMLCAGFREHHPSELPGSKYETASMVGEYMVYPKRYGKCSKVSEIATKYDVMSSLQARLHCDLYDGSNGPKCLSYAWDMGAGELRLCASVPQGTLEVANGVETAWQRPITCAQISNRWSVAFNKTWGYATNAVRRLYMELGCKSSPSTCQQLSDFYGLSPKLDAAVAERTPGSIRDLWLHQRCGTSPIGVAVDRQKPAYQRLMSNIETVEANVAEVDAILTRASASKSTGHKTDMQKDVTNARKGLEASLERIQRLPEE